jgi:hypothetical protein
LLQVNTYEDGDDAKPETKSDKSGESVLKKGYSENKLQ